MIGIDYCARYRPTRFHGVLSKPLLSLQLFLSEHNWRRLKRVQTSRMTWNMETSICVCLFGSSSIPYRSFYMTHLRDHLSGLHPPLLRFSFFFFFTRDEKSSCSQTIASKKTKQYAKHKGERLNMKLNPTLKLTSSPS